jgi:hypothetical protein
LQPLSTTWRSRHAMASSICVDCRGDMRLARNAAAQTMLWLGPARAAKPGSSGDQNTRA